MPEHDDTKAPGMMSRIDDDDVEGHGGHVKSPRATEDDDVEGHGGHAKSPRATEDDDVEGHFGQLKSPSSRGE